MEKLVNPVTGETFHVLESNEEVFKIELVLRPHGAAPADHFHPRQEQLITVTEGELHCRIGRETRVLRAGESARIPAGVRHNQWNPTDREVRAIEEVRPALKTHDLFRVLFALAHDGQTDAAGLPKPLIGAAFLAVFKMEGRPAGFYHRMLFALVRPLSRLLGYERIIRNYIIKFERNNR